MKVFIKGMDKKPEHCTECPICDVNDQCDLISRWYDSWEEQYAKCPLVEVEV